MARKLVFSLFMYLSMMTIYLHGSRYRTTNSKNRIQSANLNVNTLAAETTEPVAHSETTKQAAGAEPEMSFGTQCGYWGISQVLTLFAGLCSGLTVGMTGIEKMELEMDQHGGKNSNDPEKRKKSENAERLLAVLKDHHLLLATLLLSNAASMEALPIFLDAVVPAWAAIVLSTTQVLVFGEVVPQAVCTGPKQITIACKLIPVVRFLICILWPICKPMALLLDKVLGVHGNKRYKKKDIKELIKLHEFNPEDAVHGTPVDSGEGELTHEEVGILLSTIELRDSTVLDPEILIPIDKVFFVDEHRLFDRNFITQLMEQGFTRFPICKNGHDGSDGKPLQLLGLIGMKRILGIDITKNRTIKQVLSEENIHLSKITYVTKDTTLLTLFRIFQSSKTSFLGIINKHKHELVAADSDHDEEHIPVKDMKEGQKQEHKDLHKKLWSCVTNSIVRKKQMIKDGECMDLLGFVHIKDIFEKLCAVGEFEDDHDPIKMLTKNIAKRLISGKGFASPKTVLKIESPKKPNESELADQTLEAKLLIK